MNGYKTFIAALVSGPLSAWVVTNLHFALTAKQQAYIVGAVMTAIMAVMRVVTKGPVPWLVKKLNEEQVKQVTEIVEAAVLKHLSTQPKGEPNV